MTLIIGAKGSMGRRYQTIFKFLKLPYMCVDVDDEIFPIILTADRFIVATPTDTHFKMLYLLAKIGKPVLCEKPITKSPDELCQIFDLFKGKALEMVMQYKYMSDPGSFGLSEYDYYNHGKDGLAWDCIQIIGLARGPVEVRGESPIWRARLNGQKLSISSMDFAYIDMIRAWFANPIGDFSQILDMHQKTSEMALKCTSA